MVRDGAVLMEAIVRIIGADHFGREQFTNHRKSVDVVDDRVV